MTVRVLVVDDEPRQREIVGEILREEGHDVTLCASGPEALRRLEDEPAEILLTDLRMPEMSGVDLLREAKRRSPDLHVILMTAYATVSSAVEAMKDGAFDYLQKPFDKDELVQRVGRAAERTRLVSENRALRRRLEEQSGARILGESPALKSLLAQIEKVARGSSDVLVTGESGTGKELVARRLHFAGPRASGPFVPVNCAAIPESLAESELFGHEKGAFTNATSTRSGRFEQADGGTLFLDEIGSMPVSLQSKLLRVLQDRVVERVGGSRRTNVDVRIVAATNDDLRSRIDSGDFREDLFHRLNVIELTVPPLRERREDVPVLAREFRDRAAERSGVPAPELADDLLAFLEDYPFPETFASSST